MPTSESEVRCVNHDQATMPPTLGLVVQFLTCRCHELIKKIFSGRGGGGGSSLRTMRPCKIPFPQKSRGSGRVVPLIISVHGLGGLVNVCLQVWNNNQTLGLLREVLS